ncbi:hypothetical protein OQH61_08050 [Helicobacter sp. MIT 21-1697]|uniref:hypothetical protein n=1 Tax=Helicobacter sp. MIT 21-1697 TaxID=2993733 RepID=UPI00224AE95A|nr:hypothetical protein [Helicobacter sp. MIT 21-1697]MCX2717685.1 hypothetical protein [Helicobacter sp. MIT 21-1697]
MKLYILCLCGFIFGGCVDIKIASEMEKTEYFTLYTSNTQKQECKVLKPKTIGLLDVYAPSPFDSNSLILFDNATLQVSEIKGKKWINSPKEMLKTKLLSKLQNKCFQISIEPFGTQKFDKILKVSLLSLQVLDEKGTYSAQMSVFYEVLNMRSYTQSKSGTLTSKVPLDSISKQNMALGFAKASDEVLDKMLKAL